MRALNRKLLRDLWQLKAQSLAIVAVIGTGVAMFTMYLSTFESLDQTQRDYYDQQRFAHVFASCKRAPLWLADRIAELPNVARVDHQIRVDVSLDMAGFDEPVNGRLLSIPETDQDTLNDLVLRRGQYIEPGNADAVLVHEAFAEEHGLAPGDHITAVINGRRRDLEISGIALSPEYIYVIGPGDLIPDHRRFGIFWMGRSALAAAFDMEGGFNQLSLRLSPGPGRTESTTAAVLAEVDRLLEPYGGLGAIERRDQQSHWFIENELRELRTMASVLPVIFLAVAAFLLNIVLSRSIAVQRTQIAALKALGYTHREIGSHYLASGLLIALLGLAFGSLAGAQLGGGLSRLYAEYFRFPTYIYALSPQTVLWAGVISMGAAAIGSHSAIRRAVALPPAEAMRPEPPARYKPTRLEEFGLRRLLGPAGRMTLRNIARKPWRFALSSFGVGMAIALLILGSFFIDAIDHLISYQFEVVNRQDMTVTLVEPRALGVRHELQRLPGVLYVEPFRSVPVKLRHENRDRYAALLGLPAVQELNRVVDGQGDMVELPPHGLVVSRSLANLLDAEAGDPLDVEVLEGARPTRRIPISRVVDDLVGLSAYIEINSLAALIREEVSLSGAFLSVDPDQEKELHAELKQIPGVAGAALNRAALRSFRDTIRTNMMRMIFFNILFSVVIAVGVVYNAARISLSEHSRDLASLRIMGFTRQEIAFILLGELAVVTVVAIPIGLLCGRGLAELTLALLRNELYRIPLIIDPSTYGAAVSTVVIAAFLSGLLVRRRLSHLDLVAVLKTSE